MTRTFSFEPVRRVAETPPCPKQFIFRSFSKTEASRINPAPALLYHVTLQPLPLALWIRLAADVTAIIVFD